LNRVFNFSSQAIIERLKNEFIPYTGDTAELQPEFGFAHYDCADWFMRMVANTGWRKEGNTTQGLYVAGADGTCYGRKKTMSVATTHRFMNACLEEFKKKPPKAVAIDEDQVGAPFSRPALKTTSVLRVFSRIRPVPEGADNRNTNLGRDMLWIYPEDLKEILTAAGTQAGEFRLPNAMVSRMTRFALVDLIRGEPDFWRPGEVTLAEFKATRKGEAPPPLVVAATPVVAEPALKDKEGLPESKAEAAAAEKPTEAAAAMLPPKPPEPEAKPTPRLHAFTFTGKYAMTTLLKKGLEGVIHGEFEFDETTMKLTKFRAYAKGEAWGSSTWTIRGAPKGKFPIVFALVNAADDDAHAHEVSPAAVARNADYKRPMNMPALQKK
jgi:hypothetical protein